jgi:altronate dehydratase
VTTARGVEILVPFIRLNPNDNVAVAGVDISAGTALDVDGDTVVIRQAIGAGHKFALADIAEGDHVIKYGEVIGRATQFIHGGEHVHLHNLQSLRDNAEMKEKLL